MRKLTFTKKHNLQKLNQEIRSGLPFLFDVNESGGMIALASIRSHEVRLEVTVPNSLSEEEINLITNLINNHDPTPVPQPLSEIDQLKISQAEQFETILLLLGGM